MILDALFVLLVLPFAVAVILVIAAGIVVLCILSVPIMLLMLCYYALSDKGKKAKNGKVHESKL